MSLSIMDMARDKVCRYVTGLAKNAINYGVVINHQNMFWRSHTACILQTFYVMEPEICSQTYSTKSKLEAIAHSFTMLSDGYLLKYS